MPRRFIIQRKPPTPRQLILIVCQQPSTLWPGKEVYTESTGIKMSNAGGGDDASARVFHLSGRALWTLSTQSGQRVASITVTVSATCNVGNNNSFKTLQWVVKALCRTWESHLWHAAENLFWTQSLQRAICFDSSACFLFKLSLDLIDDPFLSRLLYLVSSDGRRQMERGFMLYCYALSHRFSYMEKYELNLTDYKHKIYWKSISCVNAKSIHTFFKNLTSHSAWLSRWRHQSFCSVGFHRTRNITENTFMNASFEASRTFQTKCHLWSNLKWNYYVCTFKDHD